MKRLPIDKINLNDKEKEKIKQEIVAFYLDVLGEDIGIIRQQQIYDLFMEELAPIIYNKALDDAKRWYSIKMDNIDNDFYELYKEN